MAQEFLRKTHKLLTVFPSSPSLAAWNRDTPKDVQHNAAYCIIDLNDLWGDFCRELIIDNASGHATDLSGVRVHPTNRFGRRDILNAVSNNLGHEPKWHSAKAAVKAEKKCDSNKSAQIQLALFATSSPAPFINTVRNYFCHRRSNCRERLGAHSAYDSRMNYDAYRIGNFLRADGRRNIEFWIDELRLIATACAA
ncbi:hypothetical protein [Erythrobacter ani]|uniref:Uncharacterized protein n=1 Tax=Erythrobacter ani TaxID=2827235 RepID=A0ABS6SL79_9SPHN|nr:hypothetical protein [Erythrobacter ani]MBV7265277.1 hypothetical protein [Erythrobacter ani]